MIEVAEKLWVGAQHDFEALSDLEQQRWGVVHAAKEPYHRQLLGYTTRGAPKDDPEYLFAERRNRFYMNLVDVEDKAFVRKELIDAPLVFLDRQTQVAGHQDGQPFEGRNLLIHCNKGGSRAPTLAMLYLAPKLGPNFEEAEEAFREMYPAYAPAKGVRDFAQENWVAYHGRL